MEWVLADSTPSLKPVTLGADCPLNPPLSFSTGSFPQGEELGRMLSGKGHPVEKVGEEGSRQDQLLHALGSSKECSNHVPP